MSHSTVRDALVAFFATPAIPGLGKVYKGEPFWAPNSALGDLEGEAFVWLHQDTEQRATIPAYTGTKEVTYNVTFALRYSHDISLDVNADDWVINMDTLIDAIKDRLRTDLTFGTNWLMSQAALTDHNGTADLTVRIDAPNRNQNRVECWAAFDFTCSEFITA